MSNFVIWVSDLRILSLSLPCLWFWFPVHLCVGGFGFLVVVGEAWEVVEVACTLGCTDVAPEAPHPRPTWRDAATREGRR